VTGSSFQFSSRTRDEEWDYSETKKGMLPLRKIKRARLYETGPVAFPAYEDTTVSARAVSKVEEAPAAARGGRRGSGVGPDAGA
jgi:phage head maturation protease